MLNLLKTLLLSNENVPIGGKFLEDVWVVLAEPYSPLLKDIWLETGFSVPNNGKSWLNREFEPDLV